MRESSEPHRVETGYRQYGAGRGRIATERVGRDIAQGVLERIGPSAIGRPVRQRTGKRVIHVVDRCPAHGVEAVDQIAESVAEMAAGTVELEPGVVPKDVAILEKTPVEALSLLIEHVRVDRVEYCCAHDYDGLIAVRRLSHTSTRCREGSSSPRGAQPIPATTASVASFRRGIVPSIMSLRSRVSCPTRLRSLPKAHRDPESGMCTERVGAAPLLWSAVEAGDQVAVGCSRGEEFVVAVLQVLAAIE